MQLAVRAAFNEGHDLIKQTAPKVTNGVLGKGGQCSVVADSAAKPNNAVQEQQTSSSTKTRSS